MLSVFNFLHSLLVVNAAFGLYLWCIASTKPMYERGFAMTDGKFKVLMKTLTSIKDGFPDFDISDGNLKGVLEIIGKITANKYDAWQYGQPSRNL